MENTASRVHSHLQLNHTESTLEVILSIRISHLCKHEQIAKHQHTQSRRYLPSFTSGFHAFFHFWNITFVLCAGLCASTKYCQSIQLCCVSIMMLGLTKKISVMEDQSYSLQLQSLSNWNDEETFRNMRYCEGGGTCFFHFSITSVILSEFSDYVIILKWTQTIFLTRWWLDFSLTVPERGVSPSKIFIVQRGAVFFCSLCKGNPKPGRWFMALINIGTKPKGKLGDNDIKQNCIFFTHACACIHAHKIPVHINVSIYSQLDLTSTC